MLMSRQPDDPFAFLAEVLPAALLAQASRAAETTPSARSATLLTPPPPIATPALNTIGGGDGAQPSDRPITDWTCASWLDTIKTSSAVSGALLNAFSSDAGTELDMVRSLCDASKAELATRLLHGQVAERVAAVLVPELQKLRTMKAATGAALHAKFAHEVAESGQGFMLKYSDLSTFYGGLEAKIGTPSPNFAQAMAAEHTRSADSQASFSTSNYGVTTTPEMEWLFVTDR